MTQFSDTFWSTYSEDHFWRLNDKTKVRENSVYYDPIYDTLLPHNPDVAILDVACGGGHFLAYLARKGFRRMVGVDIAPGLVDFVRKEIWPEVVCSDAVEYLKAHPNAYDVIVGNDIIEHFDKKTIIEFLLSARAALKPNGRLLLKTPNMATPFAARHRYVDFTHEVGFTEQSLNEVCRASGFSSVNILSEQHAKKELKIYKKIRKLYRELGQEPPEVLSINLIAVCQR